MKLSHLAFLFLAICLPLYLMGYSPPLFQLYASQGNQPLDFLTLISNIASQMTNLAFAANVFLVALGAIALSGFSAVYVIPALIIAVVFNYVLVPTSFLIGSQCGLNGNASLCLPPVVVVLLTILLNVLVVLTFAEYIRGGG